ncbi:uncharacterized protein LOC110700761 [Chenopodium quinoa]|uniref:uncharacterized protein LOC110700761 n=1 Tax=Chenopodium quinoa TaxID=63459 RepID=UPI000B76C9D8|nr:uncharacterized protein LOC110700761 [Chenopodium quinoa]
MADGNMIDVRTKKYAKTGLKPREFTDEFLQSVSLYLRQTERSYAAALNISHVTLHYLKKKGRLRTHTTSCKPALTANHKIARMKWVLSHINPVEGNQDPSFEDMSYAIHIDEKWFYLNPDKRRFYLLPSEEDPYMAQQSRRFKLKAMFMAIIGKPLYGINGELLHDGKYGIFPFTVQDKAKKSSKNRAAVTMVTRALQNVNREVIRDMLLNKVIPAIKDKWPESLPKNVVIQWDMQGHIKYQEMKSLFRSIQSLQYQSFPNNLDELVEKKEIVLEAVEYLNTMFRPAPEETHAAAEDMEVDAN